MTGSIAEEKIVAIRNAADIIEIVSETVLLKKAGANHIGLCPFHSEKTPSFTVRHDKQIFHCFCCGIGGDVFSFMMKSEGISFPEAARRLARRYGIEIPDRSLSPEQDRLIREREELLAVNQHAMEYYHEVLRHQAVGKKALAYLTERGINAQTIDRFQLGFAPAGWDQLVKFFTGKRLPLKSAEKAGLITAKQNGYYDRFRSRIMFPIMNISGQVIAFGGRVMDDALPKYLNSPETPVFSKSRTLYGLHLAKRKCRESDSIFIVEGYMDFLALHQRGIENAAATLGTAMTAEHIRSLKGFASKAILVYDSDQAGLKAAQRSIAIMDKDLNESRILVLPAGHDPDSFLMEFGPQEFLHQAEKALGIFEFLVESAVRKHGLSIEGKLRVVAELEAYLVTAKDSLDLALYSKELAERIQVDQQTVLDAMQRRLKSKENPRPGANQVQALKPSSSGLSPAVPRNRMERWIIAKMIQFPEKATPLIESERALDYFEDQILKTIGMGIMACKGNGAQKTAMLLGETTDPEQRRLITSLAMGEEPFHAEGWRRLIRQFIESHKKHRGKILSKQIKEAEAANDQEGLIRLLAEKQRQISEKQLKLKDA